MILKQKGMWGGSWRNCGTETIIRIYCVKISVFNKIKVEKNISAKF